MENWLKWQRSREAALVGPLGDVSLIAMHDITQEIKVAEISGIWSPTAVNDTGLWVEANEEDVLFIQGEALMGRYSIVADETIVTDDQGHSAMATSQPESNHLLAIWDENCEALQRFEALEHFDYNEQLIVEGRFVKDEEQQTFTFTHTSDDQSLQGRNHVSPGVIMMTLDGQEYRLRPFAAEDYYIVVFRDATSGVESYEMGRMLVVKPAMDGSVTLDFNYAFLPPCASSHHFNCPMPPFSNRFTAKINAGEKNIRWAIK